VVRLNSCEQMENFVRLFVRLCVAAKSAAPQCARRYYLMAKHDGVDIDEGSVAYSDNEVIFNIEWGMAVDDSNAIQKFSAMYEPWGTIYTSLSLPILSTLELLRRRVAPC
jgi:hypothetical protein